MKYGSTDMLSLKRNLRLIKFKLIVNIASNWLDSKEGLFEFGFDVLGKQREKTD